MATLSADKRTGNWRILFVNNQGDRKTVFLGKAPKRLREECKHRIEKLVELSITRSAMTPDLAQWAAELDDSLAAKLAKVGLIAERVAPEAVGLQAYCERFIRRLQAAKKAPTTIANWRSSFDKLVQFVGPNTELAAVTAETAETYHAWLTSQNLADGSIQKVLIHTNQLFKYATELGLTVSNPFAQEKHRSSPAAEKPHVSKETVLKVMEHADEVYRIILALARFAGMRAPSEPFSLRWDDINFERGEMIVTSPKLRNRPNYRRLMPLFIDVREHLERYRSRTTPEPDGYVLPYSLRKTAMGPSSWGGANLSYPVRKIIRKAGFEPWPELFNTLRSSCETQVMELYGVHGCHWLGNSPNTAMKHYFRPLDSVLQAATTARIFG